MKYFKRLKVWKNYNGDNYYDPAKQEAFSYKWWRYLQNIDGKLVFNNYSYSVTTSKHQRTLYALLGYTGEDLDNIITISIPDSLEGIYSIKKYIKTLENDCEELKTKVLTKGTRRTTNENRTGTIKNKINKMQKLIDTFGLTEYTKNVTNAKKFYNEALGKYGGTVKIAVEGYLEVA